MDPTLATLDQVLDQQERAKGRSPAVKDVGSCLAGLPQRASCVDAGKGPRQVGLRVALDCRYKTKWKDWMVRLDQTIGCVNRLYAPTGIQWKVETLTDWDPGPQRHDLHALLTRVQQEILPDNKTLVVGITVWDERRIYALSGGEVGLSQRGSCVVPSWPRTENDCVILAHELGHLVGARHVPGKQWIMGWAARPFHLPAADPLARVMATYRFHPRNVAAVKIHRQGRFTKHGIVLPEGCRERIRQIDGCWML